MESLRRKKIIPDGISENLEVLDENIFIHGYFCEIENGK